MNSNLDNESETQNSLVEENLELHPWPQERKWFYYVGRIYYITLTKGSYLNYSEIGDFCSLEKPERE